MFRMPDDESAMGFRDLRDLDLFGVLRQASRSGSPHFFRPVGDDG